MGESKSVIKNRTVGSLLPALFLLSVFVYEQFSYAIPIEVSEAPKNNLSLTVKAIKSAKRSIALNIYELGSPDITQALVDRVQAGVRMDVILEGQPVGGMSRNTKEAEDAIVAAMRRARNGSHFYEMTSKASEQKRRFRFNHAKYLVADQTSLLLGSENYSTTGNPSPTSKGNRGWEVWVHDADISQDFNSLFNTDADVSSGDLREMTVATDEHFLVGSFFPNFNLNEIFGNQAGRNQGTDEVEASNSALLQASEIKEILSPDNSLKSLLDALKAAKKSIDLELMTFYSTWGRDGGSSPLFEAVIAAAKRGVAVRVLVNNDRVFSHSTGGVTKNEMTVKALNTAAKKFKVSLSARVADLSAMKVAIIHNKGLLIDGDTTLVSSINWDENSVNRNREAALLIKGPGIYKHYLDLFEEDWNASAVLAANAPAVE